MDGRNGGAQQKVWEMLMEMERSTGQAKEEDQGALAFGPGLRAGQSSCGVGLGDALQFPKEDLASAVRHQRRVQFEGCVAQLLQAITAIARVKVVLLTSTYCVAGCTE